MPSAESAVSLDGAPDWIRPLGTTGLTVSAITLGGGPLGSMPENFGYEVAEGDAIALVDDVLKSPIRVIDTSNGYSEGRSEERIGKAIATAGGLPSDFLVITKTDALEGDYSGERVRESVRESKARLGLDTLPLVHLHDPEYFDFDAMTASGGAVETLIRLRDEGAIGHIGLAGGDVHEMSRYLDLGVFEVCLVHNRWTLVDRSATALLDQAASLGVAIVNAAVYGGGILANPRGGSTSYGYRDASAATLTAIASMDALCENWGIDLATAAVLFSRRNPAIATTIVGFSRRSRLEAVLQAAATTMPDEFWAEIETLLPAPENWLDHRSSADGS